MILYEYFVTEFAIGKARKEQKVCALGRMMRGVQRPEGQAASVYRLIGLSMSDDCVPCCYTTT